MCEHETFWTLLRDGAHWEFEIFLMLLVDGVILGLLWPFLQKLRKHMRTHQDGKRPRRSDPQVNSPCLCHERKHGHPAERATSDASTGVTRSR